MESINDKFTDHFKKALLKATVLACQEKKQEIEPIHLLWALSQEKGSLAAEILTKAGLKYEPAFQLKRISEKNEKTEKDIKREKEFSEFSSQVKKVIEKSVLTASNYHHRYIGTEHLLDALLKAEDKEIKRVFLKQQINLKKLGQHLSVVLKSTSRFPDLSRAIILAREMEEEEKREQRVKKSKTPALDFFGTNLTSSKTQNSIDPVIGRIHELNRMTQILSRRTKNNPILLGEPGVGKTAIVEGLAKKILASEVPDVLLNKKVYSLDLSLTVAGTIYRGEFESRLKQIINEVKCNPNIILFIDEIHNITGAGSASGSLDAANILKPALARGEIRCIGATTFEDYKKYIESDPALERRFQAIQIEEPTSEETLEILRGIKKSYEKHHRVIITDEAIRAAVTLSSRYLPEKFLPDKAIDLIDEAAARKRVKEKKDLTYRTLLSLEEKLENLREKKQKAVREENFPLALEWKKEEGKLLEEIDKIKKEGKDKKESFLGEITAQDIKEVISEITQIPLSELIQTEREKLLNLEKEMEKKIKGQNEALEIITSFIKRARAGLSGRERPLGSFIFLGPSGVGKTETAKVLAETVFGTDKALIRFDMSEFAEGFNVSKLIGAPAGYVGYKEGGNLTEAIRKKPYAVVLFDEIEKAHPEVFNTLLQILEDGTLTDAAGKKVNFKNTLLIMTSNIGLADFNKEASLGFGTKEEGDKSKKEIEGEYQEIKEQVLKQLRQTFNPEFLNRIDKIIVFKPLTKKVIQEIVEIEINKLLTSIQEQNIELKWNPQVIRFLTEKAFSPEEEARGVRKVVQELIENPLAEKILALEIKKGDKIKVKLREKKIVLEHENI